MVTFFSGNELVEIALGIERNGFAFYEAMADGTDDDAAKSVFSFLAREEKKHEAVFRSLGGASPRVLVPESYAGEHMLYVKALVDSLVFQNLKEAKSAAKPNTEIAAVDIGIRAEKDSILFYGEVEGLVRESDRPTLVQVLNEEKNHLKQLSALKSALLKTPQPRGKGFGNGT